MVGARFSVYAAGLFLTATMLVGVGVAVPPNKCDLEGFVVDDEFVPVAGASVALLDDLEDQVSSGADGSFEFKNLEPATYAVAAVKLGFEPAVESVDCPAGETAAVTLVLHPIPAVVPFVVIFAPMNGEIGCAVGALSISTQDFCGATGISPNSKTVFNIVPPEGDVNGAVYEMSWVNVNALGGKCLALRYPHVEAENFLIVSDDNLQQGEIVSGSSPLNVRIEAVDLNDPLYAFDGGTEATFSVRVPGSSFQQFLSNPVGGCNASLVVGQPFTLYASLFYNGAVIPPGYTHLE